MYRNVKYVKAELIAKGAVAGRAFTEENGFYRISFPAVYL
jgi:hypothetical protein